MVTHRTFQIAPICNNQWLALLTIWKYCKMFKKQRNIVFFNDGCKKLKLGLAGFPQWLAGTSLKSAWNGKCVCLCDACILENGFLNEKICRVGLDFVHRELIGSLLFVNCCNLIWVTGCWRVWIIVPPSHQWTLHQRRHFVLRGKIS